MVEYTAYQHAVFPPWFCQHHLKSIAMHRLHELNVHIATTFLPSPANDDVIFSQSDQFCSM